MPSGVYKHKKGRKPTKSTFQKGHPFFRGKKLPMEDKKHSKKTKEKMRLTKLGKNNPNWIEDRSLFIYPDDWTDILRESIRQRDNYVCQECGTHQDELDKKLDVHHIDYDKDNCNPTNLITLCRKCHIKTNYNREYWQQYFKKNG